MATKTITFEICTDATIYQSFKIPMNYSTKKKSIQELYFEIQSKFGEEDSTNVLDGEIDPHEFEVEFLGFNGFSSFICDKDGKIIDCFYESK